VTRRRSFSRGTDGDAKEAVFGSPEIEVDAEWAAWQRTETARHLAVVPADEVWRADPNAPALRTIDEIRARADKLEEARLAIPEPIPIDEDPDGSLNRAHSMAAAWFHEMRAAMYSPAFGRAIDSLKAGDRSGLEPVLRFLEADPWCFRSGYVKADVIPSLTRVALDESEKARLRAVVMNFVDCAKPRRELHSYVNLARAIANSELRAALIGRLESADPVVQYNARTVVDGLAGQSTDRD
jgi:hypothetical protein